MRVTDIIMSAPMVRAILREVEKPGTGKTETRRLAWAEVKASKVTTARGAKAMRMQPIMPHRIGYTWVASKWQGIKPGDRIYVRENFKEVAEGYLCIYKADYPACVPAHFDNVPKLEDIKNWRPAIHMPRRRSRLTLDVTAVKIERLQDIHLHAVYREGIKNVEHRRLEKAAGQIMTPPSCFRFLWESLHGPGSWEANPEVVAITFKPYVVNVDKMEKAA